jgi:hypothetical protein
MRRDWWLIGAVVATFAGWAAPARADITAFLGVSPTPETRLVRGLAVGGGFLVVGFEVEMARVSENLDKALPGLTTGMGNVLVQTPLEVAGFQLYGTSGVGVYRERLGAHTETSVAANVGGGIKLRIAGPLRARIDYRLFRLRGTPLHATYHRVYAGANLGF